jgi:transcriptional regulator with XRE-family HTH domain
MQTLEQVLGRVIAERRLKAGLTQEALAFQCDLHPTYVSQLERGLKSPTVRVLAVLAEAMGERPSRLLALAERRRKGK